MHACIHVCVCAHTFIYRVYVHACNVCNVGMYASVCLSLCLFACLSVCLAVCLSVCMYVCMSVCLSMCVDLNFIRANSLSF